jgi:phage terminase large subunit
MPTATTTSGIERWLGEAHAKSSHEDARRLELPYIPFPKQREFHACPAKYRLFGGAAGPGKSKALLMEAILQANESTGADTLLLRRTFPELEGSLLLYFRRDVPRELYRNFNDAKHVVTWWNGSTTRFGYSQGENDVYQYQGSEFLFIGIDELTHFTLKQWQFLTSRNRCPVARTFPCMAGATNPGNTGHAWVKALWIDKQPAPGMEGPEQYDSNDYAFISARVWDNPIYANDAGYLKTLNALPTHLRRAFLDGDWNVFAGQYFDVFDPSRHTARAETIGFAPWWPRWISIDWGFEHPAAVYWHATAPARIDSDARLKAGAANAEGVITYRELVQPHLAPRALAQAIIDRSRDGEGQREKIDAIYLSPDAFAHHTDEATIAEQMGDIFASTKLPRPVPADNDRIGGWMLLYQMLAASEWLITENCVELIRILPILTRDSAKVEDVFKMDGDDAADAARYGLKSRIPPGKPPLEQRLAERVTASDPTIRAIQARKAMLDEQRKSAPVHFTRRRG